MKIKGPILALALLFAGVTVASAQDANLGTWKLNEAKSRIAKGATKNHTVVYESAGDLDTTKVIVDGTAADGSATHNEWTGKFNGLYYAVAGDPISDMRMYSRINDRTLSITGKKDGKVTLKGTITISRNGSSRTVSTSVLNAQGRWVRNTAVYDKQ
ncbi:MAG TPA: hypothetical protein VFZ40_14410 [Pyrinomonadaceae bacterium]